MVQIPGKYELVENRNFYEFLVGLGVPEAKAKEDDEIKGTITISRDGDKITFKSDNPDVVTNLVIGKEVEEQIRDDVLLSTTQLEGNILKITCKTRDGKPAIRRTVTFSDSGAEMSVTVTKDDKNYSTTRIYKRI